MLSTALPTEIRGGVCTGPITRGDDEMGSQVIFSDDGGQTWQLGGRTRTETALSGWLGNRAGAGKLPPNGFPKSNSFDG